MTPALDLQDTLRGSFIAARHRIDIAQDWLLARADSLFACSRPPWISADMGVNETHVHVHLSFRTRSEAMGYGAALMQPMEEGSSYFDVQYEHFCVHLHYVSSI